MRHVHVIFLRGYFDLLFNLYIHYDKLFIAALLCCHIMHQITMWNVLFGFFKPGPKRDLEVHDRQERIHAVLFLDQRVENLIIWNYISLFVLSTLRQDVNAELGSKLKNLHFLVDLHVSVLPPHAPVKHFVEENITVVSLYRHLEDVLFEISFIVLLEWETQRLALLSQFSKESRNLVLFDF